MNELATEEQVNESSSSIMQALYLFLDVFLHTADMVEALESQDEDCCRKLERNLAHYRTCNYSSYATST
jgi:hypothetical protein